MNLIVIFLTGLTVGGLTCLAVQGGLLASVITAREEETIKKKGAARHAIYATAAFLVFKLIAYVLLGFILGAFGGALNINGTVQSVMQLLAGIYMIAVGFNLLDVHPIFRYAVIQPPRFLTRLVRNQSRSKDFFAPAFLGAMTIFIPCGITLGMEALAISSANAFLGALILGSFILGTMPLFFGIGVVTSLMGEAFKSKFMKFAAFAVIFLGLTSINGSLVALGSPLSVQSIAEHFPITFSSGDVKNADTNQYMSTITQNPVIEISSSGYSPNYIRVKKGIPVVLTLDSKNVYSCAAAFRIPAYGIAVNLAPNDTQKVAFTPSQTGQVQFNCSMGMYRGVIEVL